MLTRTELYEVWRRHYAARQAVAGAELAKQAEALEKRMRALGRFPAPYYRGFNKRALTSALGMSLGIHKQLLGGLTSSSWGGRVMGGGRE